MSSTMSVKCTNCAELISASFLSDHVCGGNGGGMAGVGTRAFQKLALATPPLSPAFFDYGLRTPSPLASRMATPVSPFPFPFPSSHAGPYNHGPVSPRPAPSPLSISIPIPRRTTSPSSMPVSPFTPDNGPPPTPRLPFLQKYKTNVTASPVSPASPPPLRIRTPRSPPTTVQINEDEDEINLAYDRNDDEDQTKEEPASSRTSVSSHSVYSSTTRLTRDFLSSPPPPPPLPPATSPPTLHAIPMSPPRRSHTAPTTGPRGGTAGVPSPLGPSSPPPPLGTVRSISDAKQHHTRRLRDSDSPASGDITVIPTSPPGSAVKKPRVRICVKCDVRIDNGRWIRMDGGKGILCEMCWKNMYLPRCRRCSKVIETAAVYSSDGQLKGKYHKQCFTCTICDASFPSNTFWIYEGQPMCEYHYHKSNRSLCAAKHCQKPIDGACAITEGDIKYHPGCLVCSTQGCKERLEEYWEVDGKMVCERHAREYCSPVSSPTSAVPPVPPIPRMFRPMDPALRVQKRTTRLITLQSGLAF